MERKPEYEGDCPRCGGLMPNDEHPGCYVGALSRWDNKTYVCSPCGESEAMLQWQAHEAHVDPQTVVHPTLGTRKWQNPEKAQERPRQTRYGVPNA